ncbi:hypothetical protein ACLBYD_15795 [Rhodococcus sp. C26F]
MSDEALTSKKVNVIPCMYLHVGQQTTHREPVEVCAQRRAEAAVAAVDNGPAATRVPALDAVEARVQAGTLMALLSGEPDDRITADRSCARLVSAPDHEAAWIASIPDAFTEVLAEATDERLSEVVGLCSETEEFWSAVDYGELLPVLRGWRALAQTAHKRGEGMYCWMAL